MSERIVSERRVYDWAAQRWVTVRQGHGVEDGTPPTESELRRTLEEARARDASRMA